VGRSSADAPEIDGVVHIEDGSKLKPGDWVQVKVLRSDAHDLWGELGIQQTRLRASAASERRP
jgi:ribosomal protein S12 methylthiotransferase